MADESVKTNPITMTRFLIHERMQFKDSTGSFSLLLQSVQLACKVISNAVRKAGIKNLFGESRSLNNVNASGDGQKKLDVFANDVFINALTYSDQVLLNVRFRRYLNLSNSFSHGIRLTFWARRRMKNPWSFPTPLAATRLCLIRSTARAISTAVCPLAPFLASTRRRRARMSSRACTTC
jgi:hypothetical protein